MRREIFRDLKTDSFVSPGDQGEDSSYMSSPFLHLPPKPGERFPPFVAEDYGQVPLTEKLGREHT